MYLYYTYFIIVENYIIIIQQHNTAAVFITKTVFVQIFSALLYYFQIHTRQSIIYKSFFLNTSEKIIVSGRLCLV